MPLTNRVFEKNKFPPGIIVRMVLLLMMTISATLVYDLYWRNTNAYVDVLRGRIQEVDGQGDRPLVVMLGASLEMLGTNREWRNEEFDWLRLIIQGSKISEFAPVVDDIVSLQPALVVIGVGQFGADPFSERLRGVFKRMLRAPLETAGIMRSLSRHDGDGCGVGVYTIAEAMDRVDTQYRIQTNELSSSRVVKELLRAEIPLMLVQTTLINDIETGSQPRNGWLAGLHEDAIELKIPIAEFGLDLGQRHFCADSFHMNNRGRSVFEPRLKTELLMRLEGTP